MKSKLRKVKARTANTGFTSGGLKCLDNINERALYFYSSVVLADSARAGCSETRTNANRGNVVRKNNKMRKLKIILLLAQVIAICPIKGQELFLNRLKLIDSSILVTKENVPIDSKQYYFPIWFFPKTEFVLGEFDSTLVAEGRSSEYFDRMMSGQVQMIPRIIPDKFDTNRIEINSIHLFSMKEPLLFNSEISIEVYRFLLLRTFHRPISIRFEKNNDNYYVFWKETNGYSGGYSPGKLIRKGKKKVSKKNWEDFQALIDTSQFWYLSHEQSFFGFDGSNWILEGSTPSKYQVIDRWSPGKGTFYDACMFLLKLSDLKIEDSEIY